MIADAELAEDVCGKGVWLCCVYVLAALSCLGSRFLMKVVGLKGCRLLSDLLTLMKCIGRLNLWVKVNSMLFPVSLLSPAMMSLAMLVILWNRCIRSTVPRLAALLTIRSILRGVSGLIPVTMWWTPLSLLTRLVRARRWLVALVTSMLMLCVCVVSIVLKTIEVELVLLARVSIGMLPCLF